MRVGLIAEFNPLHTGHKYLIDEIKKIYAEECNLEIICVMSEYFTQRGEVAIINGYKRAKEAVLSGCDIVLSLPYRVSVNYSDDFAYKSIEILNNCGITHLAFGTEKEITFFEEMYKQEQTPNFKIKIKTLIKKGYSYPKIMNEIFNVDISTPNFILAYSYYKAIQKINPKIKMIPIKRKGQNLNENHLANKKFLSATTIRNNIGDIKIKKYLSENMYKELNNSEILTEEKFYNLIKYKIVELGTEKIKKIYDVAEGLENRIYKLALQSENYSELVNRISAKRYSKKRIQRILLHILTETTKEKICEDIKNIRVLAINKNKTKLIREINNNEKIKLHQKLNSKNGKYFSEDIKISRIYNLFTKDKDIYKENIQLL